MNLVEYPGRKWMISAWDMMFSAQQSSPRCFIDADFDNDLHHE